MNRYLFIIGLLISLTTAAFARDPQSIEGTLEVAKNMFVIVSDQTLSAGSDFDESIAKSRRVMLAGYSTEQAEALNNLAGKRVRASGILGQAFTRYHTEPLVLVLQRLPKEIK
jgi:hypothetical protein